MRSGKLTARVTPRAALGPEARAAMWAVFARYYDAVTRASFERDLDKKQHVILLRDSGDGSIQGFSTIEVYSRLLRGKRCEVIFSGDTIIDEAYWGQQALQRAFATFLYLHKLKRPRTPVYWFLISKGYRTYVLMSRNFSSYWPRHDAPTPAEEGALLGELAAEKFGSAYDAQRGVLSFPQCEGRLKDGVVPIEESLLQHADIRFFLEKNPHHARGDELCCLGLVDLGCVWRFSTRALRKLWRRALPGVEPRRAEAVT